MQTYRRSPSHASIRTARADLKLDKVGVGYSGDKRFALAGKVEAIPLKDLAKADVGSDDF
jgi:hypothetical protein